MGENIVETIRGKLFTAVVGDVLDQMGHRRQFLPPEIRPLSDEMRIVGRAMPVLEADVFDEAYAAARGPLGSKPFGVMMEALDDLKEGEIYVATGASFNYALWGELMSMRARYLNAAGAILNGYLRDGDGIVEMGFPAFSRGRYAQDQGPRGKVIDYRLPIEIGDVRILPGDLIFGDKEGVVVIPEAIEVEVVGLAVEKASIEGRVAGAIRKGMSATQAFEEFGVL